MSTSEYRSVEAESDLPIGAAELAALANQLFATSFRPGPDSPPLTAPVAPRGSAPDATAATSRKRARPRTPPGAASLQKPGCVNVDSLLYKGDLRENYIMQPGDTLYLPATFWAKAMRVLNPILTPMGQAAGTAQAGKAVAL